MSDITPDDLKEEFDLGVQVGKREMREEMMKKLVQLMDWDFRGLTREDIMLILNRWQRET